MLFIVILLIAFGNLETLAIYNHFFLTSSLSKTYIYLDNIQTLLKRLIVLECREGWYGDSCSQQCAGRCRDNTACNHVTGQCEEGCESGWTGTLYEKGTF